MSHNELREIPAFAFRGLDYALWELHLHHNKLTEVPAESIMVLEKLSLLNLSGISITFYPDMPSVCTYLRTDTTN